MDRASSDFHERLLAPGVGTDDPQYRNGLFHYSRPKPVATGILGLESHTSLIAGGLTEHDGEQAATHLFTDTPPHRNDCAGGG